MQDGRTRTGLLKGKISYMAPEQARGDTIDRRADIWSLGVVLWEAVTGTRLFKGVNEAATLNLTLSEEVSSPSIRRPDLPPELEAILMRALRRNPDERYPTAAAMRDELEAWLSSRELLPSSSVSVLMQRLFGREMREQRQQIQALLQAQPEPAAESGVTMIAPLLGTSHTLTGLRNTQVSSVTDLIDELTRQRRITTRLLGGLLALMGVALLAGLFYIGARLTMARAPESPPVAAAALVPQAPPPPARPPLSLDDDSTPLKAPASPATPQPRHPAPVVAGTRASRPAARAAQAVELAPPIAQPVAPAQVETGLLNLDTSPWSFVSIGGRALGQTPIVGASLPAGTHTLVLTNPEQGLKTTYQVTITGGRTTARRIGLE
jgi:eukaryotic-like serine/threonine-protein kinase